MYLEFVVVGVPISNQSAGTAALTTWRLSVESEAKKAWNQTRAHLKPQGIIINFHTGIKPSLDLDNMSKPILDVMQKIVYDDDRQVRQAEFTHVRIDAPFVFVGASKLIVASVQAGNEFVYIRVDDPVDPFPLPR